MPFRTSSAPDVSKRMIQELIEGFDGKEMLEDDFVNVGMDSSLKGAIREHSLRRHVLGHDIDWLPCESIGCSRDATPY